MLLKSFIESWLKIIFLVLAASFQLASRHVEDIIWLRQAWKCADIVWRFVCQENSSKTYSLVSKISSILGNFSKEAITRGCSILMCSNRRWIICPRYIVNKKCRIKLSSLADHSGYFQFSTVLWSDQDIECSNPLQISGGLNIKFLLWAETESKRTKAKSLKRRAPRIYT